MSGERPVSDTALMNETVRIPKLGSRWVWEIDNDRCRQMVEVTEVKWNGEEWWVRGRTLPEAPTPMFDELTEPQSYLNELERFWEAATPVGGAVEQLSGLASLPSSGSGRGTDG